jgi:hypothetical protein
MNIEIMNLFTREFLLTELLIAVSFFSTLNSSISCDTIIVQII